MSTKRASDDSSADVITSVGESSLQEAAERRRKYAELTLAKRGHEADAKKLSKELAKLADQILDDFAELGTDSMRTEVDGTKHTVYLKPELWAGALKTGVNDKGDDESTDEDWARAIDAARAAGLDDMIGERFNAQTFSSWLREFRAEHGIDWRDQLPDGFADAIRIDESVKVKVRKA